MREYRDRQRTLEQLCEHLSAHARELQAWERVVRLPVPGWTTTAPGEPPRPLRLGEAWSNRHGLHGFRSDLITPPEIADCTGLELVLDFDGEGMATLEDVDGRILDRFGTNPKHQRFCPLPLQPFRIVAEVSARGLLGVPNRAPVLAEAALEVFDVAVRALRRRIEVVVATISTVDNAELARSLAEVAEIAVAGVRLPTRTVDLGPRLADQPWARGIWERGFEPTDMPAAIGPEGRASVLRATEVLESGLADLRRDYPKLGHVLVTGHAHIDYAWLWPQPETVRKIHRTFNAMASLLDKHPDFRFAASSALMYQHVEQDDPALFRRIKALAAEGRWEVIGGMLIECDTNMPSAEAFARQFLYGQQYFRRHFGTISRTAWLPDTFGFSSVMPQLLRASGIDTLMTIKISWNETNPLPNTIFRWQGNDGSRVLVHCFNAYDNNGYNMVMQPQALAEVWQKHSGKDLSGTTIATYGWGNGGGGPTAEQIETLPILNLMPTIPTVEHGNFQRHFDVLHETLRDAALPVWQGELYLEYHRGVLTTQSRTKALNRRAEQALVAAEAMTVLARMAAPSHAPGMPDLMTEWELLLRNQFHDILPGSSIREVHEQAEAELSHVVQRGQDAAMQALSCLAEPVPAGAAPDGLMLANLSGTIKSRLQLHSPTAFPPGLSPQRTADGWVTAIDQSLPPLSVSFVNLGARAKVRVSGLTMENDLVRVRIDASGRIGSMAVKDSGREVTEGPGHRLMAYRNDLPRRYDAWDIEPGFELGGEELVGLDTLATTEVGPHLVEITVARRFQNSKISTRYRLWSNSPRLDIVTDIDWHDRRTYLRALFPVAVLAETAQFDQAIGVVSRATHDNTSWQQAQFESCGHRFVSLSETDFGAALLSADRYGFSAKGSTLSLSLLRGPMFPDMMADEGYHRIRYALLPHDGRWWSADVQAEADLVNAPPEFVPSMTPREPVVAPIGWLGQDFRFHALKASEDGDGAILRLSESAGRRGAFNLSLAAGLQEKQVSILEDATKDVSGISPFQLLSWRLSTKI